MSVVAFDYAAWEARYPEFAAVTQDMADAYFAEACLYCDNTALSPVLNLSTRALLLNMVTAHIAALYSGINGGPPSPLVGRIASAGEGSVNVSVDLSLPAQAAFFSQTKYGLSYWQATAVYRTMHYRVPSLGYCGVVGGPFGVGPRFPGCW